MTDQASSGTLPDIRIPEAPEGLRRRRVGLVTALKFFGPGAIIASLTIGSGESILASREGAVFGYTVLWAVLLGVLAKGALVYASNRHITLTGEHPMMRFARVMPGPRGWFPLLLLVICLLSFPGWASGVAVALGDYLETLGAGDGLVYALGVLAFATLLSWIGGYPVLEKVQVAIAGLMVVLVLVAVFVARPDWLAALRGLLPGPIAYQPFVAAGYPDIAATSVWVELAVFMGGLGGGMYDYIGYGGLLREKRWGMLGHRDIDAIGRRLAALPARERLPLSADGADVANARAWSRAPLFDMLAAFVALGVIAAAFMINGAAILGAQGQVPEGNNVLTHQGQFLALVAPVFEYFYIVAIVMVLFGTVYAVWEVYSWTAYESLSAVSERIRARGQRAVRPYVYAWTGIGAVAMVLTGADFVALITPASVLGGVIACGIYGAGLLYVDRVNVPGPYRMSAALRMLVAFGSVFLTVCGTIALLAAFGVIA
ncbi:Nramp family divalent metal transporter [Allonocardiopsis opalescens]|uniref:Natural resistance-associated macrophage protein n=1 Tax=Allonocardiopsis opalescens TaxID=1144618 RepID=A0A2T0QEE2_9ACTN|nr:Nramp family divalent metal transporter [Allonocardiopsis opalescens]PRY02221.1 natural resistance-associated macrophage protein [Allonocardiopsis opalescens]